MTSVQYLTTSGPTPHLHAPVDVVVDHFLLACLGSAPSDRNRRWVYGGVWCMPYSRCMVYGHTHSVGLCLVDVWRCMGVYFAVWAPYSSESHDARASRQGVPAAAGWTCHPTALPTAGVILTPEGRGGEDRGELVLCLTQWCVRSHARAALCPHGPECGMEVWFGAALPVKPIRTNPATTSRVSHVHRSVEWWSVPSWERVKSINWTGRHLSVSSSELCSLVSP